MLRQLIRIVKALLGKGEEEVNIKIEIELEWYDLLFLLVFVGMLVYALISLIQML